MFDFNGQMMQRKFYDRCAEPPKIKNVSGGLMAVIKSAGANQILIEEINYRWP